MTNVASTERRPPRIRLQARGFRSLRDVDVALGAFHVLVGPNGSGKSTLLDAVAMIGDIVTSPSLGYALGRSIRHAFGRPVKELRAADPRGLHGGVWAGRSLWLSKLPFRGPSVPICVVWPDSVDTKSKFNAAGPPTILSETFSTWDSRGADSHSKIVQRSEMTLRRCRTNSETSADRYRFRIRSDRSAFAGLPADDGRFPVANWFRNRFSRPRSSAWNQALGTRC